MRFLEKISSDPNSSQRTGRYKDKNGYSLHGIFKRTYKKTQDILFISNGVLMAKYKFPIINITFESPMLNLYNLHLCGGWFWSNIDVKKEILNRVIRGLKPMGEIVDKIDKIRTFSEIAEKEELRYKIATHKWENYAQIRLCKDGRIKDIFDIDTLFSDYCEYHSTIFKTGEGEYQQFLIKILNNKLSDFLDFNISTPFIDSDIIITGLILGYPIWSTISVMWMQK